MTFTLYSLPSSFSLPSYFGIPMTFNPPNPFVNDIQNESKQNDNNNDKHIRTLDELQLSIMSLEWKNLSHELNVLLFNNKIFDLQKKLASLK